MYVHTPTRAGAVDLLAHFEEGGGHEVRLGLVHNAVEEL
jgi:hypothetical protein